MIGTYGNQLCTGTVKDSATVEQRVDLALDSYLGSLATNFAHGYEDRVGILLVDPPLVSCDGRHISLSAKMLDILYFYFKFNRVAGPTEEIQSIYQISSTVYLMKQPIGKPC
jgi:hypothetical protein